MKRSPREFPKLRELEILPIHQGDQELLLISDPLQLAGKQILVPIRIAPVLGWMDGGHDIDTLASLAAAVVEHPPTRDQIAMFVEQLELIAMLEGDVFEAAYREALEEYLEADFRRPMLAGSTYPAEAAQCKAELDRYIAECGGAPLQGTLRGLISPHIDYQRGWEAYARVWSAARQAAAEANLAIIFGTDHFSDNEPLTLTRQNYATPYGILPAAQEWIERAANALDSHGPFDGELRHRREHSIELASVWLHHMRDGDPIEIIPVLCGDIQQLGTGHKVDSVSGALEPFLSVLRDARQERKTLVIAAADLSHVGPAFGDPAPDDRELADLSAYDQQLMEHIEAGAAGDFLGQITSNANRTRVCGTAPIYLALQTLAPTRAERLAYRRCPADATGTSIVTICGHLLT